MTMKESKAKLTKKPLALSPLSLAIAACGGGGGSSESTSSTSSNTSSSYGSYLYSITSREMESNNTPKTSNFLKQTTFSGQSYSRTDNDYYMLNIRSWDVIKLTFSSNHWDDHEVSIIDSLGITLSSKSISTDGTLVARPYHDGEVYILVEGSDFDTENYTISLSQISGNYEMEPNNFPDDADVIYNNTPIKGQSFSSIDDDYFVFTATSGTTTVSFSSDHWDDHQVTILNSAQQTIAQNSISNNGSVTASTIIGQKFYVLVAGSDFDQEEYTLTLSPPNSAPTGNLSIKGEQSEGQTLTVDTSSLADLDGLGSFAYQWFRDGVEILSENSQNYRLNGLDIGSKISVKVSYTDGAEKKEIINSEETNTISSAKTAQYYTSLFFEEFSDLSWSDNIGHDPYTYGFATPENKSLWTGFELLNVRYFTSAQENIAIEAMSNWDEALPNVHFTLSTTNTLPDIFFCIGSTDLPNATGQWNSSYNISDRTVTRSLIRFEESKPNLDMRKIALHEIGNVLGLGDIKPNGSINSIMESPTDQNNYVESGLSDFDISMINTIYNYDGNLEIIV